LGDNSKSDVMKAMLFALCFLLVLAGTAVATNGYDDSGYYDSGSGYDYGTGSSSCCCGTGLALFSVAAFAMYKRD
jgi:hypothetical protein